MKWKDYVWPVVGLAAVIFSGWMLYNELRGISASDVLDGFAAIPAAHWLMAACGALVAYAALAGYDHIALTHIGKPLPWWYVTLCSFTTYALSHNIGGSVVSGAVIRYRAYGSRGLTGHEVGVLVGLCWLTFVLSTILVAGIVFVLEPDLAERFVDLDAVPVTLSATTGVFLIAIVALYVAGSLLSFRPLRLGSFRLEYPRPPIVLRQLTVGPIELLGAASIIYFALPEAGNPGYLTVLGVFLIAFSVASATHAPGGIGVFELVALAGLPDMDKASVLVALLVFRLFYLIIPLILGIVVVILFEKSQFASRRAAPQLEQPQSLPRVPPIDEE